MIEVLIWKLKLLKKNLVNLVEQSNKMFQNLQRKSVNQEREENYFKFNFKKATNLGKHYLLPKIHKGLSNVPGRPVIWKCGTPTEKISEFFDHQLQPIMKQANSNIKDTVDFLEKLRAIGEIPRAAILITADVVGLYPSIPHDEGYLFTYLFIYLFIGKTVPTEDMIKMASLLLKIICLNLIQSFTNKYQKQQ